MYSNNPLIHLSILAIQYRRREFDSIKILDRFLKLIPTVFLFGSSKDIILSPVSTRCPLVSLLTQIWELGRSVLPALLGSGQLLAPTRGRVGRLFKKLLKKVRRDGEVGTTTTVYQARWRLVCALVVRRRHTRHPPWEWGYWGGSQLANTYKDRSYGGSDHTLLRKFSEDRFSWTVRERERETFANCQERWTSWWFWDFSPLPRRLCPRRLLTTFNWTGISIASSKRTRCSAVFPSRLSACWTELPGPAILRSSMGSSL